MSAKLDEILPAVLSWKPEIERSADWLRAEVGDMRARVIDIAPPTSAFPKGTEPPPLLPQSTDAPDTFSPKPALLDSARGGDGRGQIGHYDASSLREGVPQTVPLSAALQGSLSLLSIVKDTFGVAPSASTNVITTAPSTCSTDGLPEQPMAVPVLAVSSPSTPIDYGLNNIPVAATPLAITGVFPTVPAPVISASTVQLQQLYNDSELVMSSDNRCTTSKFPIHRPMPWLSFMGVHADGDEARSWPWPSFKGIIGCECSGDAIMKPAHNPSKQAMDDMVILALSESTFMKPFAATLGQSIEKNLKVTIPLAYAKLLRSDFYGNLFTCTGCVIIHECKSGELRCWNEVFLFLEYWWSTSDCVQPVHEFNSLFATAGCIMVYYLCNSGEWRRLKDVLLFPEYWESISDCGQSALTNHTSLV